MAFPAFFDACALYGIRFTDLVLRLADAGAFRVLWSDEVLEEVRRNLIASGVVPDAVDPRLRAMRDYFPDARVVGFDSLTERMDCDPKDRHVLAAAVRANAGVLVTFNLKDFPDHAVAPFDVEVVHPDDFLLDQLDLFPGLVIGVLRELASDYENPPQTIEDVLDVLRRAGVPHFAEEVRRHL